MKKRRPDMLFVLVVVLTLGVVITHGSRTLSSQQAETHSDWASQSTAAVWGAQLKR